MNFEDIKKIYFVGVGGIGMSAIARYFNSLGVEVHGYDKTETELTKQLSQEGMKIHYEDDVKYIPEGVDLVVFTPAIPKDHKELTYFIQNNFVIKKRAEVLGIISKAKKAIAVAGTHGKTTTTTIITHILRTAGIDCTAFLGGIAGNYGTNYLEGKSDWVVVEADEYDRSFMHLHPTMAVINSLDADHLDIYGSVEEMRQTYGRFAGQVKKGGFLLYKEGLPLRIEGENYGDFEERTFAIGGGEYQARHIIVKDGFFVFDIKAEKTWYKGFKFTLPGYHNIENATAAVVIALKLGIDEKAIKKALKTFKGVKRRFDIIYRDEKIVYVDDYAHHPAELSAAIDAAKMFFEGKKVTVVFQPHLFSRTRDFMSEFATALATADEVLLMDIYPARELPIEGITSEVLFDKIQLKNKKLVNKENLMSTIATLKTDVLMTLGAGDIDTFIPEIKDFLQK